MRNNAGSNSVEGNALNHSLLQVTSETTYPASIPNPLSAMDWHHSPNQMPPNAPRTDHSSGMILEIEQARHQDDPELVMTKSLVKKFESENNQLRIQVKKLQLDKDAIHSALDEVNDKLEDTILELEETRQAFADKIKESTNQNAQVSISDQKSPSFNEDELERLKGELQAKDIELRAKSESLLQQEILWKERTKRLYTDFEAKLLHQGLEAEKAQKLLTEKHLQDQTLETKWKDNIRVASKKFDAEVKAEQENSQKLLSEQSIQYQAALGQIQALEAQLQSIQLELLAEKGKQAQLSTIPSSLQIQVPVTPLAQAFDPAELQRLVEDMKASHAAELEETRRLTEFFKNNSERISREARELKTINRNLLESIEAKDREMEDQLSHIYAMEAQMEEFQGRESNSMPGEWVENQLA